MIPKTLAMLKMEKNFRAHIEKKYERMPYLHYPLTFWIYRIKQEVKELERGIKNNDKENIREELADISNIVDFCFECLNVDEELEANLNKMLGGKAIVQLFEHNDRLKENN